jgi:hypothetical protein
VPDGGEGRLDRIGGAQMHPVLAKSAQGAVSAFRPPGRAGVRSPPRR